MACSKEFVISEENLWCSICLETFTNPRTLPCLHTFCHQCLSGYIKQLDIINSSRGFNCPVCRSLTLPVRAGSRSEKWADYFPVNFTLLSILNSKKDNMAARKDLCEPCGGENVEAKAVTYCFDCDEQLCVDCATYHRKLKATSKHNVKDINDKMGADMSKIGALNALMKCPNHSSEDVKFMCKDHDQLCCSDCAIISHRKCDHITSVAEMATLYTHGEHLKTIKEKINGLNTHACLLREHDANQMSAIDPSKETVKKKLSELKKIFEKTYEEIERNTLQTSNAAHADLSKRITDHDKAIEKVQAGIVHLRDLLDTASECGNDIHIFLVGTKLVKEIKLHVTELQSLQKAATSETIRVVENPSVDTIMESLKKCFEIKKSESTPELPNCPGRIDCRERVATLKSEFKIERDKPVSSFVRGSVFIGDDNFAVIDCEACTVNLIDIVQNKRLSSYACSSHPWSIVDIGESQVAVGLPDTSKILVLKIEGFEISCVNEIPTRTAVNGLAYCRDNNQLLASSRDEGSITLIKLDGTLVGSIPVDASTETAIQDAYCIAFNNTSNVCYISSHGVHKIVAIDMQGHVLFTYQHPGINHPWVITMDDDDNLYICSYSASSIHQVSKTGVFIRQILTSQEGLKQPYSMCFNKTMDVFVVTAHDTGKEIKVYDFK